MLVGNAEPNWSSTLRALGADPDGQLSELAAVRAARPLRVLAQPTRIRIVAALADEPLAADTLAVALGRDVAEVAYHLRALVDADLIEPAEGDAAVAGAHARYRLSNRGCVTLEILVLLGLPEPS